jgi:hypothetical protein
MTALSEVLYNPAAEEGEPNVRRPTLANPQQKVCECPFIP